MTHIWMFNVKIFQVCCIFKMFHNKVLGEENFSENKSIFEKLIIWNIVISVEKDSPD